MLIYKRITRKSLITSKKYAIYYNCHELKIRQIVKKINDETCLYLLTEPLLRQTQQNAMNTNTDIPRIEGRHLKVTIILYKLQSIFTNYGHLLQVTVICLPITVILVLCYGHLENILIMIYGHLSVFFKLNFAFPEHFSVVICDFCVNLL